MEEVKTETKVDGAAPGAGGLTAEDVSKLVNDKLAEVTVTFEAKLKEQKADADRVIDKIAKERDSYKQQVDEVANEKLSETERIKKELGTQISETQKQLNDMTAKQEMQANINASMMLLTEHGYADKEILDLVPLFVGQDMDVTTANTEKFLHAVKVLIDREAEKRIKGNPRNPIPGDNALKTDIEKLQDEMKQARESKDFTRAIDLQTQINKAKAKSA